MKNPKIDIVFYIVIFIALTLFVYLLIHILSRIHDLKEIIRILATIVIPIPIAIFVGYIKASDIQQETVITPKEIKIAILLFFASLGATLVLLELYKTFLNRSFMEQPVFPVFLNVTVTLAYSINYVTVKNMRFSGLISGILFGLALYIFVFN